MLLTVVAMASPGVLTFPHAPDCRLQAHEIAMVGDVMQHGMQLKASVQPDGSHSWDGVFDGIRPLIQDADLAIANLETPIHEGKPLGGYPFFNAPPALLDSLREAGFDVLQLANNHTLDRGREGALRTLAAARSRGFGTAGTHASARERDRPWTLHQLGGTSVAFLAYTYGTNGMPMPEGEPWLVNWLDEGVMDLDIARAREIADVVIVGVHWGAEYQNRPGAWQKNAARRWVEAGADVVMGSHPHVVQPAEVIHLEDRDALVLYSLGNFVSNQRTHPRDGGLIARVTVARCLDTGSHHLVDARLTPVWVDDRQADGVRAFHIVPVPHAGQVCQDDLDATDCARIDRFRKHLGKLLPVAQFTTFAGSNPWTARRDLPTLSWTTLEERADPTPSYDAWPLPRFPRSQGAR